MSMIINAAYLILFALVIFLPISLFLRIKRQEDIEINSAILGPAEVEKHAVEVARSHVVKKNSRLSAWLAPRVGKVYNDILEAYKSLNNDIEKGFPIPPAAEWLLDNFYIIEEQAKDIRHNLSRKTYYRLPVLNIGYLKGCPRVYVIALELVTHTDGNIDEKTVINFIKSYQSQVLLSVRELWALPIALRIGLIWNIRQISKSLVESQLHRYQADELADIIINNLNEGDEKLLGIVKEHLKNTQTLSSDFIVHLFHRLRGQDSNIAAVLRYLDERLAEQNSTLELMTSLEHQIQASKQVSIGNSITSLKSVSTMDWTELFEALSQVENVLRQDPSGVYGQMDFESRDYYRNEVEKLARICDASETLIALKAVECAKEAVNYPEGNGDTPSAHIGYYLIGKGRKKLEERVECRAGGHQSLLGHIKEKPAAAYLGSITLITLLVLLPFIYYSAATGMPVSLLIIILAALAVLIPASDLTLLFVNFIVTRLYLPSILPKLELKDGVPEQLSTMVIVPTLLPNEKRVTELLAQLEVNYLANRENNIYFALAGDFKDSAQESMPDDNAISDAALKGISELNERYSQDGRPIFYFFQRHRQYNASQGKWMGWERKRGAIIELNDLLLGSHDTSYSILSCDPSIIPGVKYIITLDADTSLPLGNAKKLIGALAHPLNKAVVNRERGIVAEGYGLLQPRIDVSITSANSTLYSRIFAGQGGIDPYTTAVSDVYQDLFGEGIFTGKGIYDLNVFQQVLKDVIPENAVLSHDLLEGSYIRTGLVTDISLVDGYPARFNSSAMRLHRWVRGDWQLLPWLGSKVKDRHGRRVPNPLSTISKWKILDNLRRSLLNPSLLLLIILGIAILPGNSLVWIGLALAAAFSPTIMYLLTKLFSESYVTLKRRKDSTVIQGFRSSIYQSVLQLVFIPYQAYLMCDAVMKTVVRVLFTRRNMLEWVTAADMEAALKNNPGSYWRRMWVSPVLGVLTFILALLYSSEAIAAAILLMALWASAPHIAYTISQKYERKVERLSSDDIELLRRITRKTWRYFEDMVTESDNYLAPDNFQDDPPNGIAHRTSPTNIGLMLTSILCARDFGYVGAIEMAERLDNSIKVIEKMDKWNGHLYNWYNTQTLEVLRPMYVSTVDSGNFVGYLMLLEQGLKEYTKRKLIDKSMAFGIRDTVRLFNEEHKDTGITINTEALEGFISSGSTDAGEWRLLLDKILSEISVTDISYHKVKKTIWGGKLIAMLNSFKRDLAEFLPMLDIEDNNSMWKGFLSEDVINKCLSNASLEELIHIYKDAETYINRRIDNIKNNNDAAARDEAFGGETTQLLERLREVILDAGKRVEEAVSLHHSNIKRIRDLAEATRFAPLYDQKRQLFSIGYNIEENRLTKSYYDLFASEARQASYIAIARGEVDKRHWFRLGRRLTQVDGYKGLVSWTGTMFEYLMPPLIMKNYENTLLDETYYFVVRAQKKYGEERNIPWGTSESAYYAFDINLNYQYRAFGVPELGLKRGLVNDMVVAPYATILALDIDPKGVVDNIRNLINDGMEGAYGLYEAVDYTPSRLHGDMKSRIVKNFMVHHQGMCVLALDNYLNNNIIRERFHRNPVVKAAEILLQERVPERAVLTKEFREKLAPVRRVVQEDADVVRKYGIPDSELPHMHILSNGNYSVMVTNGGSGYSKSRDMAISRWRETASGPNSGTFVFVQNINSNNAWSATFEPFNIIPERYRVTFSPDKAVYVRKDGNIETHTEVIVSTEDDAEIRRITVTNHSQHLRILEVTSYFEVVLTHPDADLAHPTFSNLFVITEFNSEYGCLLASRRPRSEHQKPVWAMHTVTVEGETAGNLQYETDRSKFIGRNRDLSNPLAMDADQPLSNTVGPVLDPVMSLRRRIVVRPGQSAVVSYVTAIAEKRSSLLELAEKYSDPRAIERASELAWNRSHIETRYLGFRASEIELYLNMVPSILLAGPLRKKWADAILKNSKGQPGLWKFGVSGDIPIILVSLRSKDQIDMIHRLLKAHEYWRLKGLNVDMVILMEDETSYVQPLHDAIRDAVSSSHARDLIGARGGVFILNGQRMAEEDKTLLYTVARIALKGDGGDIEEQLVWEKREEALPGLVAGVSAAANAQVYVSDSRCQCLDTSVLEFYNGLGGFSEDGREYLIYLSEKQHTPAPWINVISNERFGFNITEVGGGYTWSENSRENKLTPWSNDPISDMPGEIFYIKDENSSEFWSITPLPIRETEDYIVRHGQGYSLFEHTSHGIEQQLIEFVSVDDPVKICIVSLKNASHAPRELSVTYYMRPVLGVHEKITSQYITTQIHDETKTLLITNTFNPDFSERVAFIDTSEIQRSLTGDRTEFFGINGSAGEPEALKRENLSGTVGAGLDPCAAVQVKVRLMPGENRDITFLLGQGKNAGEALSTAGKYRSVNQARAELERVKRFWRDKLDAIQVHTPDNSMNIMLNSWLQYQVISCRLWARSAFYQSGGAYGFRDQLQDVMAVTYTWPELTRKQILLHAAHQFIEGDVQHWWHTGADKGIRTRYSDDFLWLPYVTADYIRCTGERGILDEVANYLEDAPLAENEDERYNIPKISEQKSSIYEHCIRAIENGLKFGEHGIPLMGCGDWNDGMNTVGNKGKGESVWLGWFLYTVLMNFIPICMERNDTERAERYKCTADEIARAIEENAWDGSWYRRAYFDDGKPLGSAHNTECRIDAIAQSWSAISGIGKPSRVKEALSAVQNYLIDREVGIIKLLTPPFNESDLHPGYIKGYVPGVRENGGQYTHAAVWTVLAFAKLGEGDMALDLYHLINPINHSRTPIECSRYKVEPYVMAADVYAVHPNIGRGGWTWYTGAAGWMYRVGMEHIIGIKKNGESIVFDPCIPSTWDKLTAKYTIGYTVYNITFKNPKGVNKGVKTVLLDGKQLDGAVMPLVDDKMDHRVEVIMG